MKKKNNNKQKNAPLENLITKKMRTGPNLHYDEYGSCDYPKKILLSKPLEEVKKKMFKLQLQRI